LPSVSFSQTRFSARSAAPPTSTGPAPSTSSTLPCKGSTVNVPFAQLPLRLLVPVELKIASSSELIWGL
jgi:hypothetical protein